MRILLIVCLSGHYWWPKLDVESRFPRPVSAIVTNHHLTWMLLPASIHIRCRSLVDVPHRTRAAVDGEPLHQGSFLGQDVDNDLA